MANVYAIPTTTDRLRDRVVAEVRAWRGRLNLTQGDLARIIGVSQAAISDRMRGKMEFSLTEIEALAAAFGIDPTDLMPPPRGTRRPTSQSDEATVQNLLPRWSAAA